MATELLPHPIAELFTRMSPGEFAGLLADIKANGQHDPIIVADGKILDGRNRYKACIEAGIKPKTEKWNGAGSPLAFVISKNLHRRHLNETQRAMIAARLATLKNGQHVDIAHESEATGIPVAAMSQPEAAALLNVSVDSVGNAKKVLANCLPEEIQAANEGRMTIHRLKRAIKTRTTKIADKRDRKKHLSHTGKNPERIQKMQQRSQIWSHVRTALIELTSLPRAADVVPVARAMDRNNFLAQRLPQAISWLKEFEQCMHSSKN